LSIATMIAGTRRSVKLNVYRLYCFTQKGDKNFILRHVPISNIMFHVDIKFLRNSPN